MSDCLLLRTLNEQRQITTETRHDTLFYWAVLTGFWRWHHLWLGVGNVGTETRVLLCVIVLAARITNEEVRRRTGQPPVTSVIAKRRLRLFGHLARADPSQDHSRILRAAINRPPADWRRRADRPRRTWLRTIELDLRPHLNTPWMRAQDRSKWRQLVETAMLTDGRATRWWWW